MTLLLDIRDPDWLEEQELKNRLQSQLPGVDILCNDPGDQAGEVTMLVATRLYTGVAAMLPNLRVVQKLGAGVDGMVDDPDLADSVRVVRMRSQEPAMEIAEYCMAYVLKARRNIDFHRQHQIQRSWRQQGPKYASETTVGVLGLGHIGGYTARSFASLGYRVLGWSRTTKQIAGVDCTSGIDALHQLLPQCDFICCILPSTERTRNLFDANLFKLTKPDAMLINAGRGDLIVEQDLIQALDNGCLGTAVLDVFQTEPLPQQHPLWGHPKVTVTPHVSGWHVDGGLDDIAENYRRMCDGEALLNEVSRTSGY